MQMRSIRPWVIFSVIFLAVATTGKFAEQSYSANLTNVSVTLSNSRLSFKGALGAGNTESSSQVTINASGYPSTTTKHLFAGQSISIGSAGALGSYTITDVTNETTGITVTPILAVGHADTGDDVIASQSGTVTVDFTTANAVADGKFQILLPAETNDNIAKDGIPDSGFFDFTYQADTTATKGLVTCPANTGNYAFNETDANATASAATIGGLYYHVYECGYSGAGGIGTTISDFTITNVINPAPKSGHTVGTADTYKPIVRQLDSSGAVVDQTTVSVGVIEAVRVTATVAPQITFSIAGVAANASRCGGTNNIDVTSTTNAVRFGEITLNAFSEAAHNLTVSTNAADGYAVTAIENDQLSRNNVTCTGDGSGNSDCIIDSLGEDSDMDVGIDDWNDASSIFGFGYTLENVDATSIAFQYSTASGNCAGGNDCHKQFADAEAGDSPESLFSSTDVADSENAYICYKLAISSTQAAGNYENYITYTATANF